MPYNINANKPWTRKDNQALERLAQGNTPRVVCAFKLGRTPNAVRIHAAKLGVSLRKKNLSPYGE